MHDEMMNVIIMRWCVGMKLISDTVGPDVFILGCGSPLGSLIGHVDANRVSADAGLSWYPPFPLPFWDKWNLPSGINMIRNTLTRSFQHNFWWINDPDCILLRKYLDYLHFHYIVRC